MHLRIRLALRMAWVLERLEYRKELAARRDAERLWIVDAELHTVGG